MSWVANVMRSVDGTDRGNHADLDAVVAHLGTVGWHNPNGVTLRPTSKNLRAAEKPGEIPAGDVENWCPAPSQP